MFFQMGRAPSPDQTDGSRAPDPRYLHTGSTPSMSSNAKPTSHPASAAVRTRLPQVIVAKEDLLDESNQECVICLEEQRLGGKVTKLPCNHIFCNPCVSSWLERNNSCPVCRFELPTGITDYDKQVKMTQHRKATYRISELMTLSSLDLRKLLALYQVRLPQGCLEKREIIDALFESKAVEMLPELEDAVYAKSEIEAMSRDELVNMYQHLRLATPDGQASQEEILAGLINSGRILIDHENKVQPASPSAQKRKSESKPEPAAQARRGSDVSMGLPNASARNGAGVAPTVGGAGAATSEAAPIPPRYTEVELKSLSVGQLKKLLAETGGSLPGGLTEKSELVQLVSESISRSRSR